MQGVLLKIEGETDHFGHQGNFHTSKSPLQISQRVKIKFESNYKFFQRYQLS